MDEEALFHDIHRHLVAQAAGGEKMDTEMKLAERFGVSRYRVRRVLDSLARLGVVERAQKRGMTLLKPEIGTLSKNIGGQIGSSGFDVLEHIEARLLFERKIVLLAARRITPMCLGRLSELVWQMEKTADYKPAHIRLLGTFHRELLAACGNRVLTLFAESLLQASLARLEEAGDALPDACHSEFTTLARAIVQSMRQNQAEETAKALEGLVREEVEGALASRG